MSDERRRRPPSVRPGPAPREPLPMPGMKVVVFHFDTGGDVSLSLPESEIGPLRESVGRAWNEPNGQMFTLADEHGRPSILIHLGKVRAVEIH